MRINSKRFLKWMGLIFALVAIEQGIKILVQNVITLHDTIPVLPSFNLVHVLNPGAAFSFLSDAGGWQRNALSILALIICLILLIALWRKPTPRAESFAYALIIAGGLGNVIDRIRIGAVVDFVDFYWRLWHWPAFNFADAYIFIAAGLLLFVGFKNEA
ncbi:MAG: lipoprotein signal peptidase [Polaromonas sp.]|nr:lipoprotein signal peptidase [Polaromonas sp.]MBP7115476.1 lipoprotein signal peptidase [Polaromonas sp.]MBP9830803.1 lipoprotein signal peptidase [Polaromonas sp.]